MGSPSDFHDSSLAASGCRWLEAAAITEAAIGPDGQAGIAAFLEKREPVFTGR